MSDDNIWTHEWDEGEDWSGGGGNAKRLPRAERLGASVYEIGPGNFVPYHFHHASEELLVVLDGEMTMKTEEGERLVRRGEVVIFPVGPAGATASATRARALPLSRRLLAAAAGGRRIPGARQDHRAGAVRFADGRAAVVHPRHPEARR